MAQIKTEDLIRRVILLMNDGVDSGEYFDKLFNECKKRLNVE